MSVLLSQAARPEEKFQPPRAPAFGSCFSAAQEIALRHHADDTAGSVNNGKAADFLLQHQAN
jgi:hypothetical protein